MNLVKKLVATLLIAGTLTCVTACNQETDNLTAIVASTSSTGINDIAFIYPESSKENYYVSVIGHFDAGEERSGRSYSLIKYKNHKDYRITYSVSKEDYLEISRVCSDSIKGYDFSQKELRQIQKILANYTAIDVEDLEVLRNVENFQIIREDFNTNSAGERNYNLPFFGIIMKPVMNVQFK